MKRNYYDVLDVPRNAPPEALQQAYRGIISRAASAPPDQAEAMGNEVKLARRAFTKLMHPGKRAAYDAYLAEEERRKRFVRGPAHYVPDRFTHGKGNWSGKTVWATTVITVLVLVAIGAFSQRFAGTQRSAGAQVTAEEAARARKGEEVRKANTPATAGSLAPAAGQGEAGR